MNNQILGLAILICSTNLVTAASAASQFVYRHGNHVVYSGTNNGGENGGENGGGQPVHDNLNATMQSGSYVAGDSVNLVGSVTGASEAVTWSIESGDLGPFSLSSNGVISGTANTSGVWSAVLKVANSRGETTTSVSITVNSALQVPPLAFYAIAGSPIAPISIPASGGAAPYNTTVLSNNFPNGLSLSDLSVSGTASGPSGDYSSQIQVSDSSGQSKETTVTARVVDPLVLNAPNMPDFVFRGLNYTFPITTLTGGRNPQLSLASGNDPVGLVLTNSSLSGFVTSVPNIDPMTGVGLLNLTFVATDDSGQSISINREFQILDIPSFRMYPSDVTQFNDGDTISIQLFPTGAVMNRATFSLVSGTLPSWLQWKALSSSGRFTGIVPVGTSGAWTVGIRTVDDYGRESTKNVTFTIVKK